jgi:NAD(P)-dependent dehydrogenase (short-subunit alcohol dehydrogenase family)
VRLTGRTAIVTGGAKGIGRHYSQALAAEGAEVVIADIADGSELAAEIAARHGRNATMSITFDVSDEAQVKTLVAQVIERFGKIDILAACRTEVYSHDRRRRFFRPNVHRMFDQVQNALFRSLSTLHLAVLGCV